MVTGVCQAASPMRSEVEVECVEAWNAAEEAWHFAEEAQDAAAAAYAASVALFHRVMADDTKTLLAETMYGPEAAVYHTEDGCFYLSGGTAHSNSNEEVRIGLKTICHGHSLYRHWDMPGCFLGSYDLGSDDAFREACAKSEAETNRLLALVADDNEADDEHHYGRPAWLAPVA